MKPYRISAGFSPARSNRKQGGIHKPASTSTPEPPPPPADLTLISQWSFEDTTWSDSIGSNHLTQTGSVDLVAGHTGNAMSIVFGSSQLTSNSSSLITFNKHFRLEFWFRLNSLTAEYIVSRRWTSGADEWSFSVYSGFPSFSLYLSSGAGYASPPAPNELPTGVWIPAFLEVTPTEVIMITDGVEARSFYSGSHLRNVNSQFWLGGRGSSLDELKFSMN